MSSDIWVWSIEERIPSHYGAGQGMQEEVLRQMECLDWIEHDIFGVRLAIEEAIVNAIKHGNRHDSSKSVHVVCKVSPTSIRIEVTDEGVGFDPEQVPDPTDEEHLDAPSGRGIMLMRSFMSYIEFNDQGNRVVMEKRREASDQ